MATFSGGGAVTLLWHVSSVNFEAVSLFNRLTAFFLCSCERWACLNVMFIVFVTEYFRHIFQGISAEILFYVCDIKSFACLVTGLLAEVFNVFIDNLSKNCCVFLFSLPLPWVPPCGVWGIGTFGFKSQKFQMVHLINGSYFIPFCDHCVPVFRNLLDTLFSFMLLSSIDILIVFYILRGCYWTAHL